MHYAGKEAWLSQALRKAFENKKIVKLREI